MSLDISLELKAHDAQLVESNKWRIYNMTMQAKRFRDNPGLFLDIARMVSDGVSASAIEGYLLSWLNDFAVPLDGIRFQEKNGEFIMSYHGGEYVFA